MRTTLSELKVKDYFSIPNITETTEFKNITKNKIINTFLNIDLKNKYEKNNQINYDTIVATTYINDAYRDFTLRDIIDLASVNKITVENNTVIEGDPSLKNSNTKKYLFSNLIYEDANNRKPTSLLENRMTEYEVCLKIMNHYAEYLMLSDEYNEANSNFLYILRYNRDERIVEYKNTNLTVSDMFSNQTFLYLSSDVSEIKTNIDVDTEMVISYIQERMPARFNTYYFICGVNTEFRKNDVYKNVFNSYNEALSKYKISNVILIISLIIWVLSFVISVIFVISSAKKKKKSNFFLYQVPTDIPIIFVIILLISLNIILPTGKSVPNFNLYLRIAVNYLIIFSAILYFNEKYINLCSEEPILITRIYQTYIYDIRKVTGNIPVFAYILFYAIPVGLIFISSIYALYLFFIYPDVFYLYVGLLGLFASFLIIIFTIVVNKGFIKTLTDRDKSEQMRLELISNVSHDIRTPLTSIINYSDILSKTIKNNKIDKNEIDHYTNIIYDKSNRLKVLIEDLIYSTKASSGTLEVDMQKLDANQLAAQYFVDYEDRLKQRKLRVKRNIENEHNYIYADGEKLYRVFENLFSNIFKYAKEDTDVWFSIKEIKDKEKIQIRVENIAQEELIYNENITDRFVRGDKSRNKEGFGLGLSIVSDLIKLMLGKYETNINKEKNTFINIIEFDKYNGF